MADVPIVVFDCGVFLQSLLSKTGPAKACIELVENGKLKLAMSKVILAEIKDVISRDDFKKLSPFLTNEKTELLIDLILEKSEFVKNVPQHVNYLRDKSDEPYLNLAIESRSQFLITRDRDLLDLMTSYTDEAKDFRKNFRDLKIVNPVELLKIMRKIDLVLEP